MHGEARGLHVRRLFVVWAALSLFWTAAIAADLYGRAKTQAAISIDVERDLDRCANLNCAVPTSAALQERWPAIAETYLKFDGAGILEWAILPPAALFVCGGLAVMVRRRRYGH
jgi:aspartate oxidase